LKLRPTYFTLSKLSKHHQCSKPSVMQRRTYLNLDGDRINKEDSFAAAAAAAEDKDEDEVEG
jgi:hypothetical protein